MAKSFNPWRTVFLAGGFVLAGMAALGTCRAGGQTPPLRDPSIPRPPIVPLGVPSATGHKGLFTIDVVVSDGEGKPVQNLSAGDFTLLDNGDPAKIRTLRNALTDKTEPQPELIFVLDEMNLSSKQLKETKDSLAQFLRQNPDVQGARLLLYRVTRDGLFSSIRPIRDSSFLASEVEGNELPRFVWRAETQVPFGSQSFWGAGLNRSQFALHALGSIAVDQREIPGRKIVMWIGSGWPVKGNDWGFDEFTELTTRLREARITLDEVDAWPNPAASGLEPTPPEVLDPPRSQRDMGPERMQLPLLAAQTGGLVLNGSTDFGSDIGRCTEKARSFYTLTFNPPHTYREDELHSLSLHVDRPGVTVRTTTSYYNEPAYLDNPRLGVEKVTIAQLEDIVHSKKDLARKLANLELTERLSTPRLNVLLKEIHSEKERQSLTADADLSLDLAPPAEEIADRAPPTMDEQRAIFERVFDYLHNAIHKLPDFYALRNTVRFEEPLDKETDIWKVPHKDQTLRFASGEHAQVRYRNGNEVVEKKRKLGPQNVSGPRGRDLETWGTFGPILAYVLTAAASKPSTVSWKRWERSKYGDLAVFDYTIANQNVRHEVTYCCLPEGNGDIPYRNSTNAYGQFAVNPETGAIMRIVINGDLDEERDPDVPLNRSQVMVEYGPVELGGRIYICPQRSLTISRGRSERILMEWGKSFIVYGCFETMINDVTFGGYHKFGSEARILPGFEETPNTRASP